MTQITMTFEKKSIVTETFAVTFPIYRRQLIEHDYGYVEIFTRTNAEMEELNIHRDHSERGVIDWTVEHDTARYDVRSGADYALGRGEYACTAERFNAVVAELQAVLAKAVQ